MEHYITPNDIGIIGTDDSTSIQNAIDFAKQKGVNRVVIPRINQRTGKAEWVFSRSVLLPSEITVVLDNCYMVMQEGAFCNFFRNENIGKDGLFNTQAGRQHDIYILGEGYPIMDGGKTNWFLECNKIPYGDLPVLSLRINNPILLHNVQNFAVENIEIRNPRWWSLNFIECSDGKISDITFRCPNNIQNQDGIDIRPGCHNITIERITGQSGDDLIALTSLDGGDVAYEVEGQDHDIHDIVIRDVLGCSAINGSVVLRNQDHKKLYNIDIENVIVSDLEDKNNTPYSGVVVGQNGYIKEKPSPLGSTYNVNVKTVVSANSNAVQVSATLKDCSFRNIHYSGGRYAFVSLGSKMENVIIKDVFVSEPDKYLPLRFERVPYTGNDIELCRYERNNDYFSNVKLKNITGSNHKVEIGLSDNKPLGVIIGGDD